MSASVKEADISHKILTAKFVTKKLNNMRRLILLFSFLLPLGFGAGTNTFAQTDTLRVMAYNVLNFGEYPLCQGPNGVYESYLQTIVSFANPDILGLEKMGSIKFQTLDHSYSAAIDFQDSILQNALDPAFPGRYAYCPFTNYAGSNTESLLFYDQQKLGFAARTCTYSNNEDFSTWKLYYKDPALATTHDTTFLYVTLNHDISGDGNEADRGAQVAGEMALIRNHFSHLANMINMGDFNTRNSDEPCYQTLTAPADTNFRYYDPPFYPDATFSYPADWQGAAAYAHYLSTSTRALSTVPNSCGTNGGAKDWYDHIFLSPWIVNNANYLSYIPHSYRVVGNDGLRMNRSANDAPTNTSAPTAVINAIFQMSNKYPVMVDLLVTSNTAGTSLPDPEIPPVGVVNETKATGHATIVNPVGSAITVHFSSDLVGQPVTVECVDMLGRTMMAEQLVIEKEVVQFPCTLVSGNYYLRITSGSGIICQSMITRL